MLAQQEISSVPITLQNPTRPYSVLNTSLTIFYRYTEDDSASKPAAAAEIKSEPAVQAELKAEEPAFEDEQNGDGDQQMYKDDPDDDEIDFNLGGNGNGYDAPATHEAHGPGIKEDG
jgi:hypothetical protein